MLRSMSTAENPPADRERERLRREAAGLRQQRLSLDRALREAMARNERLTGTLRTAQEDIRRLRQALAQQLEAPMNEALVLRVNPPVRAGALAQEAETPAILTQASLDVLLGGRRMRVPVSLLLDPEQLRPGMVVLLTESAGACANLGYRRSGEIATVREILEEDRLVLGTGQSTQAVARRSGLLAEAPLGIGDAVAWDPGAGLALCTVPKTEAEELVLEETPETTFADIGGLSAQIEQIRDAVELPFLHPELYREHHLKAPKGILLYGPPGNGKTLIAKAVARSLAQRMEDAAGGADVRGYFLNVKGPELLDKFVGETERQIRAIFSRARDKADAGSPVVIFFDEMESLFRTRGAGRSSDVETTIVPQLLAEIDGVEALENVIVIGATNREDMIDPAVLRPGRLDVKVRVDRPDREGSAQILGLYVTTELPLAPGEVETHGGDRQAAVAAMIETTAGEIFARDERHRYLDAILADGRRIPAHWEDFVSGALLRNVVDRAKKHAIKEYLETGEKGLATRHLVRSVAEEFAQQRDAASRADVEDWLKGLGHSVALQGLERPAAAFGEGRS